MSQSRYAAEVARSTTGSGTFLTYGPPSPHSQALARGVRRTAYPVVAGWRPTRRGIWLGRRAFAAVTATPGVRGTVCEPGSLAGVPVEWTIAPRAQDTLPGKRVVLYLHGGGYVVGSPRTHRNLTSRLSHVLATPVASVDYRMAPESTLRDSYDDCLHAYLALIDAGHHPGSILLVGDSAGGGLAAGVALRLAARGLPQPGALILLSPWVDLTCSGESITANRHTESFIGGDVLSRISHALIGEPSTDLSWELSPHAAPPELLAKLAPTLVQIGSAEVLRDDGHAFGHAIAAAGGPVEVQEFLGQAHVVAWWTGTPEARQALREIARWLRDVMPDDIEPATPSEDTIAEAAGSGDGTG